MLLRLGAISGFRIHRCEFILKIKDKTYSLLSSFTCSSEVRFCSVARGSLVPTLWPKLAPHLQKFLSVSQVLGCQVWAPNPALSWLFSTVNPAPSKDTQQTVSLSGYLLFCPCLCLVHYVTKRAKQAGCCASHLQSLVLRQEHCCEFKVSLGYIISLMSSWTVGYIPVTAFLEQTKEHQRSNLCGKYLLIFNKAAWSVLYTAAFEAPSCIWLSTFWSCSVRSAKPCCQSVMDAVRGWLVSWEKYI